MLPKQEIKNLKAVISRFPKAKILVVGDLILDQYIWGNVDRISPEAPVPVVWAQKRTYVPGGAANVANNIRALGAGVCICGVIGKDSHAAILLEQVKKGGIDVSGVFFQPRRHTTLKTRVIAGHQQVVRVDWEDRCRVSCELNSKIADFSKKAAARFGGTIIEDYGKGVINAALLDTLISSARSNGAVINVDPKEEHFQYYRRVTSITPNCKELENAVRDLKLKHIPSKLKGDGGYMPAPADIEAAAKQVMKYLRLESMLVTLGEQGMCLLEAGSRSCIHIPTVAQEVFDVSGAGDTVIAVFTLALACGATKLEAAHIANFAAGIVVSKLGTAVCSSRELLAGIEAGCIG